MSLLGFGQPLAGLGAAVLATRWDDREHRDVHLRASADPPVIGRGGRT